MTSTIGEPVYAYVGEPRAKPHYAKHIEPVARELKARGHDVVLLPPGRTPPMGSVVLVAGGSDVTALAGRRLIHVEHGAGQAYCLAPSTRVLTSDLRWLPIGDLVVGDRLVAFEEERSDRPWRQWRQATVEAKSTITQPSYKLRFADGTEIVASADHRWLTRDRQMFEWSRTADLQPASTHPKRSSKVLHVMDTWEEDTSWGAGYLAAAFDGEGHFTQTRRGSRQNRMMLGFSQRANAMLELVEHELRERKFDLSVRVPDPERGVAQLSILGGVPEVLRLLGSVRPRRLLKNLKPLDNGQMRGNPVELMSMEYLGDQEVTAVRTSTGTLIAEGFASHNSGDPASAGHRGYAGGAGYERCILFLCPNETVADRWKASYPDIPAEVVGCPMLDQWHADPPRPIKPRIAMTFHWPSFLVTEAGTAWGVYQRYIAEQLIPLALREGWSLVGHEHPRWQGGLRDSWKQMGVPFIRDYDTIMDTATLLVADNTSMLPEFASTGRPVLWLNSPEWRRDVDHGGRFWQWPEGQVVCDEPAKLAQAVQDAMLDGPLVQAARQKMVDSVYAYTDGKASERAADAIERVLGATTGS